MYPLGSAIQTWKDSQKPRSPCLLGSVVRKDFDEPNPTSFMVKKDYGFEAESSVKSWQAF